MLRSLILAIVLIFSPFAGLRAEQGELASSAVTDTTDAMLVVDASGSMLNTDPGRLRYEGARLFVQSLKSGDKFGIVAFSDTATLIRPLSAFDPAQAGVVIDQINKIESTGSYTDILAGLRLAEEQFKSASGDTANRVVVLISDGKMEPDPKVAFPEARIRDLIDNLLPTLKSSDIKTHTLYFSELSDRDLLKQIAAATDGLNWFTPSVDKIHESFQSLFLAVKKPQVLPLTSRGFKVDADVQEATFYINRQEGAPTTITSPSGKTITSDTIEPNLKWFTSPKFDVITVIKPEVGDWKVQGISSTDGFATVLTDLKLVSDWPQSIFSSSATLLQGRLYESNKPVVLPEMTGAANYAFQIIPTDRISEPIIREFLVDDGTQGDKVEHDGIFSRSITITDPGEYKLTILLKAPTFERTQQIPFRVKPRFVSLSVVEVESKAHVDKEAPKDEEEHKKEGEAVEKQQMFRVDLSPEASSLSNLKVVLVAKADGKSYQVPVTRSKESAVRYEAPTTVLAPDINYELQAQVSGVSRKDKMNELSNTVSYIRQTEEAHPEELQELVVEAEEKPKEYKPIWWPHLIFSILAMGGIGWHFFKKASSSEEQTVSVSIPSFEPSKEFEKALAALREKVHLTEVDLDDPIFDAVSTNGHSAEGEAPEAEIAQPEPEAQAPAEAQSENAPETQSGETE